MKKAIAYALSLLLLLTAIPVQAFAVENSQSEHDALIELACEVFPEYTSIICAEPNAACPTPFSNEINSVIFSETRRISDTESLGITQLASGQVIILKNDSSVFSITKENSSTSNITTVGVSGTANFIVTCNSTVGTFTLSNVRFVIYYTGSDYFSNYGTADPSGVSVGSTTKSSTYINYNLTFTGVQLVSLELFFSNDQLVARIY